MTHPNSQTPTQHDTNGSTPTQTSASPANPLFSYIAGLLSPNAPKAEDRKVWSISLHTLVPFFTATNVNGVTRVPADALGAPLRLAHGKDGGVKFSKSGRPQYRVHEAIAKEVTILRANLVADMVGYVTATVETRTEEYTALVETSQKAAHPLVEKERADLAQAIRARADDVAAEAEATSTPHSSAPQTEEPEAAPAEAPRPQNGAPGAEDAPSPVPVPVAA